MEMPVRVPPLRLIALGDSLVYGYGDREGGGWVERLRRKWMQADFLENALAPAPISHPISAPILYNLGIRGNTIDQVAQRLEQEFSRRGEYRNRLPDGLILSVGLNDSPRVGKPNGKNYTDFDRFVWAMENLLERSLELGLVYFVGMVPVNCGQMPFLNLLYYNHSDQYRYKEVTRQLCAAVGIPYLDIFELWLSRGDDWWKARLGADGLHPNSLGYASLFETIVAWEPIAQHHPANPWLSTESEKF